MSDLFLCHRLTRTDTPCTVDVVVHFRVVSRIPGYPGDWTDPGADAEYEFEVEWVKLDGGEMDDGPLNSAEVVLAREWFCGAYRAAARIAEERHNDMEYAA